MSVSVFWGEVHSHKERRDRKGGRAKCFFRCPVVRESLLSEESSEIATKNAKTAKREGPNVSLDVRWLDTHREEKRIIATKNAKIAKKGRAKCFFRCPVVRRLTPPQNRTMKYPQTPQTNVPN